jgi:RNA polymerase sigma factor (sigma-70 family)
MCEEKTDLEMRRERDRELAQAAISGDDRAWRRIYDETNQSLFNFLCYQTGDREAALDLLQETYVTALGKLDSYLGAGTLLGWLRSVALRKCLDWRRRVKLRMRRLTEFHRESSSDTLSNTQGPLPGMGDGFQDALGRLSPKQRAALLLRELEDLPFAEVAEAIGCSEATARVHHHRACANMRHFFEQGEDLVFSSSAEGSMS